ncbi:hypothetical protein BDA96_06G036600 [Sorghum bicolor]|uniref:Uncharacterized protein n=2 Tax=Sorghum bicolor TaxID=4558 RepID=A0A921QQI4_SORBI|nr:hypothetical protein BDA96_06G036600 [Sorghum bicolor]OQU81255.1 hypothetical protein SORBI_3006G033440 [Sorghum bicolor]
MQQAPHLAILRGYLGLLCSHFCSSTMPNKSSCKNSATKKR